MATKTQSMRDFSGGVVNQELQNRDDGRGVIIDANNVVSSTNGELRKRSGTRMLSMLPRKAKMVPFRLPDGQDIILMFIAKGDGADSVVGSVFGFDYNGNAVSPFNNVVSSDVPDMPAPSSWSSNTNGDWAVSSNMTSNSVYKIFNDPVV